MRLHLALVSAALVAVAPAAAQSRASRDSTPNAPLVTHRDAITFGALAASGVALMPFDARLERGLRAGALQRNTLAHDAARTFDAAGDPGVLVAGVALFGVGRLAHSPATASLGLHASEAIVLGGTATAALKALAGRQRPYVDERDADDFALLGGRSKAERQSFPSGHVTAAFAFASAMATDLARTHPRGARIATPLLYGGATLVGAARMYGAKHWASDVLVGAGVGTLAGRVVDAYARAHPHGWLERLAGR